MTLIELKNHITSGIVPSNFLILVSKDNPFLAKQYMKAIGKLAGGINYITSIYEPTQSSLILLTTDTKAINVLYTETFDERAEDYSVFENTIVVCEQVDKTISWDTKDFIIEMPKLEEWQILDYAKTLCPAVPEADLKWLINVTGQDMERVTNELDKVALFDKKDQSLVFSSICFDLDMELFKADFFTITNALVDGDLLALFNFLKYKKYDLIDPVGLATSTLRSLKNILLVKFSPSDCGLSEKQYNAINRKYNNINVTAIKQKIKFLSNIDLALKTSQLDMSSEELLTYLITNLAYKITF